ncbi:hypothetical protein DPMN_056492 [Dreissena polymorpha]|uniref:Uncharacterized protein n=1 Tax=Dreissena polymorpha TaxID=45954 RepID=A0A9D4CSL8_DREPO|nr:hypothetical protein DPMN_056492 [Dreissena polymorpha]
MNLLTKKNAPPLESHFFQANIIIFELIQDIIETNLLTRFHEDWTINVASREKCLAPGGHVFKATKTIFELIQDIIGTNLLTKFHDDLKINVTSRVLTRKIAPPPWWPYIIGMNLLTKFHEDRTINVASRVKNTPHLGDHVFQANVTIFELIQDIIKTNHLTIFHQDWTINVASRVLFVVFVFLSSAPGLPPIWPSPLERRVNTGDTPFQSTLHLGLSGGSNQRSLDCEASVLPLEHRSATSRVLTRKNAPPPGGQVFKPTGIIFEFVQDIIEMNLLTKFHEDWTINVASRVKNAPPLGSHVFQAKVTIFELIEYISGTNLLSKFHEDWTINVAPRPYKEKCPTPGGHVFQPNGIIFELIQDIIGMNLLTKFYEDQTINVASRVLTRFYYSHIKKNAPPLSSHVFQANVTIFELIQDIIETNLLTKFHEDWTINVTSRELTRQMFTPHNAQRTKSNHKSSP